ncbi:MAG TPA: STAS domain-containing protein [Acidimicrobiales bacterium]|nr:STAS domain-containing protein [Acidimicrobiales bacterium]
MDEPEGTFNIFSLAGGTDCVIEIHGELDHFPSLVGLRGLLQDAIADHPNMLIIDLAAVTSIDVSGLAVLAAARRRGLSTGTRLLLKAPNTSTRDLLAETGLDRVLPIVPDLQAPPSTPLR